MAVRTQIQANSPHFNIICFPEYGRRSAIFTGPDGLADNRPHLLVDKQPIGTNQYTREATYSTDYLWRTNPVSTPVHLRRRSAFVGEIGWHHTTGLWDPDCRRTGHQILLSEFRRRLEDYHTHRHQDPGVPIVREATTRGQNQPISFGCKPQVGEEQSINISRNNSALKPGSSDLDLETDWPQNKNNSSDFTDSATEFII